MVYFGASIAAWRIVLLLLIQVLHYCESES